MEEQNDFIENNLLIDKRIYNGDYSKGSIFSNKIYINIKQTPNIEGEALITLKIEIQFCVSEEIGADYLSTIINEIPFIINNADRIKINDIINIIKNNSDYNYNETHYSRNGNFDFRKLNYYDVAIDNEKFEILVNDNIIKEIFDIIRYNKINEYVMNNYKNILNEQKNMENNNEI